MAQKIGAKLKQLREEAQIEIGELAAAAGIDASQMELLEKDEITASISTLIKLTRRLGIRLGTILDGIENQGPAVTRKGEHIPTVSTSNANVDSRRHLEFFSLAGTKPDRLMEPYVIDVEYIDPQQASSLSHHEGEEFLYVLEGEIQLRYGSQNYDLQQGDTIYYDSIVPHCVSTPAAGKKGRILAVIYIPY